MLKLCMLKLFVLSLVVLPSRAQRAVEVIESANVKKIDIHENNLENLEDLDPVPTQAPPPLPVPSVIRVSPSLRVVVPSRVVPSPFSQFSPPPPIPPPPSSLPTPIRSKVSKPKNVKPDVQSAEKPLTEKPTEKPPDKSPDNPTEKTPDKAIEKPLEKPPEKPLSKEVQTFNEAMTLYRGAMAVKAEVKKTMHLEVLNTDKVSEGSIIFAQNRLRWEETSPNNNLIVFDGKVLWTVQFPPKEFTGPPQVIKSENFQANGRQLILPLLLDQKSFHKVFGVTQSIASGKTTKFVLTPLDQQIQVSDLSVIVDKKTKFIKQVQYKDDVGNLTTLKLTNTQFDFPVKKTTFSFVPPSGAKVTEM